MAKTGTAKWPSSADQANPLIHQLDTPDGALPADTTELSTPPHADSRGGADCSSIGERRRRLLFE